MSYDKVRADGSVIKAPAFTNRVLSSVPILFQLAEWLLIIVAFQYADVRFGFVAAKIAWMFLALAIAMHIGVLISNIVWRLVEDPFSNRMWKGVMFYLLPLISGAVVFGLLHLVKNMVAAQS